MIPLVYSLSSIRKRYKSTASIVVGIALFVFVFGMVQMLANGIERTVVHNSDPGTLVALSVGANLEMVSYIGEKQVASLVSLPTAHIQEMVREFVIIKLFPKEDGKAPSTIMIRGVPKSVYGFRKGFRLLAGRLPSEGKKEVLLGRAASERLADLGVGGHLEIAPHQIVEVVGIFQCADSSFDSELWGDLDMIRGIFGREGVTSSLRIRMNPADMPALIREAKQRGIGLNLQPEPEFTQKQAQRPKLFIETIGMVLGFFIAVASIIGVSTVMQTAVDGRKQEILLFRRMGFSASAVVVAFFREAALLGLFGGAVGVVLSFFLTIYKTTIFSVGTWSQLVVGFTPTGPMIIYSLSAGILAAVLGASLPTLQMAHQFRHSK
jgi:putative ABC transport system permease protein